MAVFFVFGLKCEIMVVTYQVTYHGTLLNIIFNKYARQRYTKTGRGSMHVVLPKEYLNDLGWRSKQKLVVERKRGGLFIGDWRKR